MHKWQATKSQACVAYVFRAQVFGKELRDFAHVLIKRVPLAKEVFQVNFGAESVAVAATA
jgi:hypothetical protein